MDTNYELDSYDRHFHHYFSYGAAGNAASKLLDRMTTQGWYFAVLKSYQPVESDAIVRYYFELNNYDLNIRVYPNTHIFFTCKRLSGVSNPELEFEVNSMDPNCSVKMYLAALAYTAESSQPKED